MCDTRVGCATPGYDALSAGMDGLSAARMVQATWFCYFSHVDKYVKSLQLLVSISFPLVFLRKAQQQWLLYNNHTDGLTFSFRNPQKSSPQTLYLTRPSYNSLVLHTISPIEISNKSPRVGEFHPRSPPPA